MAVKELVEFAFPRAYFCMLRGPLTNDTVFSLCTKIYDKIKRKKRMGEKKIWIFLAPQRLLCFLQFNQEHGLNFVFVSQESECDRRKDSYQQDDNHVPLAREPPENERVDGTKERKREKK